MKSKRYMSWFLQFLAAVLLIPMEVQAKDYPKEPFKRLNETVKTISMEMNATLPTALNKTWFELLGQNATSFLHHITDMKAQPSTRLLNMLNTSSLTEILKEYPVIKQEYPIVNDSSSFTLLGFFSTLMKWDTSNRTVLVLQSLPVGNTNVAAILGEDKATFNSKRYLTENYQKLRSNLKFILNSSKREYYEEQFKLTINEVSKLLNETAYVNLRNKLALSIVDGNKAAENATRKEMMYTFVMGFKKLVHSLGNNSADSNSLLLKGLVSVATHVPISIIRSVYQIDDKLFSGLTVVGLAHHISRVSSNKFMEIFKLDSRSMKLLEKAKFRDIEVLFTLEEVPSGMKIGDLKPLGLSMILLKLGSLKLLDTVADVAKANNISVANMTVDSLRKYGNWDNEDVTKLAKVLEVDAKHFSEVSNLKIPLFSKIINTPLAEVSNFNIIQINRALCRSGKRFNGTTCVAFAGCRISSQVCSGNTTCTDVIGSYLCKCKIGFKRQASACVSVPLPTQLELLAVMQKNFTEIALAKGISLEELLLSTWFQIVGATPEYLTKVGLTAMLSSPPSSALISLLRNTSIAKLQQTLPIVPNLLGVTGLKYNFPVLQYLTFAIEIDKPSTLTAMLKDFPFGTMTLYELLNTTEGQLSTRNYLTDIYPLLRSKADYLLDKSMQSYIKPFFKTMLVADLKDLVGEDKWKSFAETRRRFFFARIDVNTTLLSSSGKLIGSKIAEFASILKQKHIETINKTAMTFVSMAKLRRVPLASLVNMNLFQILDSSPQKFVSLDLMKLFPFQPSAKLINLFDKTPVSKILSSYPVVANSQLVAGKNYNFTIRTFMYLALLTDTPNTTISILRTLPLATGNYSVASFFNSSTLEFSKRNYLTDAYPLLRSAYLNITEKSVKGYCGLWFSMTESEFKTILGENFTRFERHRSQAVLQILDTDFKALNATGQAMLSLFTMGFKKLVHSLGNNSADSNSLILKGLVSVATHVPISIIRSVYQIDDKRFSGLTVVGLAHHISRVSSNKFMEIFKLDSRSIKLLEKAKFRDIEVLFTLEEIPSGMKIGDLKPLGLSMILLKLGSLKLLDTVADVAKANNISVANMTVDALRKYGNWSYEDVAKLAKVLEIDAKHFSEVSNLKIPLFSKIIKTPLAEVSNFNIIQINRALCRSGKRFNGTKCVVFAGCRISSQVCSGNTTCTDVSGSYICSCKIGFRRQASACVSVPLPTQLELLALMQKKFPEIALAKGMSLEELLLSTWFQIIGATPEYLTKVGLTAMLPSPPSNALINLLSNTSIAKLQQTFPIIPNLLSFTGLKYNVPALQYLTTAIEVDKPSTLTAMLKDFPFGTMSLYELLNTTEGQLSTRNYLTDIYPLLRSKADYLLDKSMQSYIKPFFKTMLVADLKDLVGEDKWKSFAETRRRFFFARIDVNTTLLVSSGQMLGLKIAEFSSIMTRKLHESVNKTKMTFISIANSKKIPLVTLVNKTIFEIIDLSLRNFVSLNMMKIFPSPLSSKLMDLFERTPVSNILTSYPVVANSQPIAGKNYNYSALILMYTASLIDSSHATRGIFKALPLAIGNYDVASFFNSSISEFTKRNYLTDVYPLLRSAYLNITQKSAKNYFDASFSMTEGEFKPIFGEYLNQFERHRSHALLQVLDTDFVGLNATRRAMLPLLTMGFKKLVLSLGNKSADSNSLVLKGLVAVATHVPIYIIRSVYKIDDKLFNGLTVVGLAHHISRVSSSKFMEVFKLDSGSMKLLEKAQFRDISVLFALENHLSNVEIDDLSPLSLSSTLLKLESRKLLVTVADISSSMKVDSSKLTFADIQRYGSWSNNDVLQLFRLLKINFAFFAEVKNFEMNILSEIFNTSLSELGKFNVIKMSRSLCSNGKRFDGNACVNFQGCRSGSFCGPNSRCIDVIGSFMCRCMAGFSGDGRSCFDSCASKQCPANAECRNVPGTSPVCKCTKRNLVLKNNTCLSLEVKVFKVKGMKFEEKFDSKYSNKSSNEFKAKSTELEVALYDAICTKIVGCVAIKVTEILQGSIRVNFDVITDVSISNVTSSTVQNASVSALAHPSLAIFKPNQSSIPQAITSNPCASGMHSCDQNANCTPISSSAYVCNCHDGYKKDGNTCKMKDACERNVHDCGKNSYCSAIGVNGYSCKCEDGYKKDGKVCVKDNKNRNIAIGVSIGTMSVFALVLLALYIKKKRVEGAETYQMSVKGDKFGANNPTYETEKQY